MCHPYIESAMTLSDNEFCSYIQFLVAAFLHLKLNPSVSQESPLHGSVNTVCYAMDNLGNMSCVMDFLDLD